MNSVIRPEINVATSENKAIVVEGGESGHILDLTDPQLYIWHKIEANSPGIIVQLAQPYLISSMEFFLFDKYNARYKYFIETSVNKIDWEIVVDRRNEACESWQYIRFAERVIVFIKITGTDCSPPHRFHFRQFKCPSEG